MLNDQLSIICLLGFSICMFLWGKIRYDIIALITLLLGYALKLIPLQECFTGFSHPAVWTVIAILIMSNALSQNGMTYIINQILQKVTNNFFSYMLTTCLLSMILSAFINNVGALALIMPIAVNGAISFNKSPATILMPLGFSSILGGMITLTGTPPNIIIASFRQQAMNQSFTMFDFSYVGLPIALIGVCFICIIGYRFIPRNRTSKQPLQELLKVDNYITEIRIEHDSCLIDRTHQDIAKECKTVNIRILELIRQNQRYIKIPLSQQYKSGDILVVQTDPISLNAFLVANNCSVKEISEEESEFKNFNENHKSEFIEVVVSSRSDIIGKKAAELMLAARYGIELLGISRQGSSYTQSVNDLRLKVGDVLLLRGPIERLYNVVNSMLLLPLANRNLQLNSKTSLYKCITIFICTIIAVTCNILPPHIAFVTGAVIMTIVGVINIKDFYSSIDWPIIILLGSMIPVSMAFQNTGAANNIVDLLLEYSAASPQMLLIFILIITMLLTDVMNNAATAIIMCPIALSIANKFALNSDAFLMAVAIGSSCSFLTPIGHQNNAIVLGPGGYKFTDYWRMGLPLDIIIILFAIPLIMFFWHP